MTEVYSRQNYLDLDVGEYRKRFPKETKALSDEKLFNIVTSTDDDMGDDGWRSLFTGSKVNAPSIGASTGERQSALATSLAAIHGEELATAISTVMKAKEDWQGGPMTVMCAMGVNYTEEQMAEFPIIGSSEKDGSNNPAKFKAKVPGKDGKETERDQDFYILFADATPEGADIVKRLGWLAHANKSEFNQAEIPQEFKDMNPQERRMNVEKLTNRRSTIRSSYKNAIKLNQQFTAVNDLPHVSADPIPGIEEGTYENTVLVHSKVKGRETKDWEHYSLSNFMKLNAAKAKENGGTLAALKATVARVPKVPGDNSDGNKPDVIKTIPKAIVRLVDLHSFFVEVFRGKDKTTYNALVKLMGGPGSDDLVKSIGDLNL